MTGKEGEMEAHVQPGAEAGGGGGDGGVGPRRDADGFLFPFVFRRLSSHSFVWRYGGKETGEPY